MRPDHLFVRDDVQARSARFVVDGVVGFGPVDHTVLAVDLQDEDDIDQART